MIQITFTPGNSAQAALVGQLMTQYLALDEQPAQEPVRTTSGLIAAAQEEAAAPAPKRTRRAATPEASAPVEPTPGPSADAQTTAPAEVPNVPAAETSVPAATVAPTASSNAVASLTLEDVRAILTTISKAGKAAEVKGLLLALGVTNLTAVPQDAYAKLVADAQAL
jgi:uncharacterized membrane protein